MADGQRAPRVARRVGLQKKAARPRCESFAHQVLRFMHRKDQDLYPGHGGLDLPRRFEPI